MKKLFTKLSLGLAIALTLSNPATAQVIEGKYGRETAQTLNYIKDGDAEAYSSGLVGYNDSAAIPVDGTGGVVAGTTMVKSFSTLLDGKYNFLFTKDAASRQGIGFAYAFSIPTAYVNDAHTVSFRFSNPSGTFVYGTDFKVYLYDITNAKLIGLTSNDLRSDSFGSYQAIFQASGSSSYRLLFHVASTSALAYTLRFDQIRVTQGGVTSGTPPNTFTAKVSSAGVVSDETGGDWINGNCVTGGTGVWTCTNNSGFFTSVPNYNCQNTGDNRGICAVTSPGASTFIVNTLTESNPGSFTNLNSVIYATKTGADFIQPAITPQNYNYARTAYTPTFTGFGTVTSIECYHAREGEFLNIDCKFASGTGTAVEGRVSLPSGLTSSTSATIPSIRAIPGRFYRNNSAGNTRKSWITLIEPSTSYIVFGSDDYVLTSAPLAKLNGNDILGVGETGSFTARIPIAGWTVTQNAPQLVGSVTSNATSALRIEASQITCSSSSSINSSTVSWLTSVGNISAGACLVTFANAYSAAPFCFPVAAGSLNPDRILAANSASTTTVSIDCDIAATGTDCTTFDTQLMCIGAR